MRRKQRAAHGRRSRRAELERLEPRWAFNVAPTGITLDPASVRENSGLLAPVGTLHVSDPDAGDTHRFILLDSAGGRFTLDGDQVVVAAGPQLDFETAPTHSITVRAIDAGGLSVDVSLPIAVTDVSETPTGIQLDGAQVPENSPAHFVVGKFTTVDQDVGDTFVYSLIDSAGGRFEISGDLLAVAPNADLDYEAAKSQVIRVRTTDGDRACADEIGTNNGLEGDRRPVADRHQCNRCRPVDLRRDRGCSLRPGGDDQLGHPGHLDEGGRRAGHPPDACCQGLT